MDNERLLELAAQFNHLGTRSAAQQVVLAGGLRFRSWRDVDAEIKCVEHEITALRTLATKEQSND